jgi:hypothetical protein
MRNQKPRMDDSHAAAASLLNHGLREAVASKSAASHVFQSPLHTGGNLRRQPSIILVNKRTRRVLVLYCVNAKALELFRVDVPTIKAVRDNFKRFCRGWVCAHLHEDSVDPVIEEHGFTVRGRMELIRGFGLPLSASEQRVLLRLMGTEVPEPA